MTRLSSLEKNVASAISIGERKIILLPFKLLVFAPVAKGYGRGSKKLGVPTANIPYFSDQLVENNLKNGVYFGWGRVESEKNLYPVVANIGRSPTFVGQVILYPRTELTYPY
jgi:riboflavin kinase